MERLKRSPALPVAVLLIGWQAGAQFTEPTVLPSPITLAEKMGIVVREGSPSQGPAYLVVGTTFLRIVVGAALSLTLGTVIGILMGLGRGFEAAARPAVLMLLMFPTIVWAFLGVMWFGIGNLTPVFTAVIIVLPFVITTVWQGTRMFDPDLAGMAKAYRASSRTVLLRVQIPQLVPYILSSARIAFVLSWKIVLVGETFGVSNGIGREFSYWYHFVRADMILAWGAMFIIAMTAIEWTLFAPLERKIFRWRLAVAK